MLALRALCEVQREQFAALAEQTDSVSELVLAQGALLRSIREAACRPGLERAAHFAICGLLAAVPMAAAKYAGVLHALNTPDAEASAVAGLCLIREAALRPNEGRPQPRCTTGVRGFRFTQAPF